MDFLARREHSRFELQRKLTQKFPAADPVLLIDVISVLRDEKLQSDERFAESYVRYRKSRGFGFRHIYADLSSRKVAATTIDLYLNEADDEWKEMIRCLLIKKLAGEETVIAGSKVHRKLVSFLESRGFLTAQIRKGLDSYLST